MSILQYISVTTYFPGTDCYIVANPLVSCNIVSAQQLRETNRWKDVIVQRAGLLWSDYFGRNKILSGYDLSHYQVPYCIRVFFYFVWFVFIHHNFQVYFKLCTYCNILDIYLL